MEDDGFFFPVRAGRLKELRGSATEGLYGM